MANKIKITVGAMDYIISSDDEENYVRKIGEELNYKLDTLAKANPYLSTAMVAVLAALEYCDEAKKALEYDKFMMGINGVVTFKKSTLPEVLKQVPLDRLVLETDSPYLAPTPFRGKRNESSYVGKVADKLAEIYGQSVAEICSITTRNALKVFKISD